MSFEKWMLPMKPADRLISGVLCFLALCGIGSIDYWADYRLLFTVLYVCRSVSRRSTSTALTRSYWRS